MAYSLPPQDNCGHEVIVGFTGDNKEFTISKMYSILDNTSYINTNNKWKRIWRMRVPERVRCFIWQLRFNRLLTNKYKSCMGMGSPMCKYCKNVEEDVLHVLRDCPLVMSLWMRDVKVKWRISFFFGSLHQWLDLNTVNNSGWKDEEDQEAF